MARIPVTLSDIGATVGRASGNINAYASSEAFGSGIGEALQRASGAVGEAGDQLFAYQERKRKQTVANKVATDDFTPQELELRNSVGPDGAGYREKVLSQYDDWVEKNAADIDDPIAAQDYKNRMYAQRNNVSSRSAQYEFGLGAENAKEQANAGILAVQNKIIADPSGYDNYISQGNAVIDAQTQVNARLREGMKLSFRQDAAKARFTGMLERAKSVEDIDAIATELAGASGLKGKERDDYKGKDWSQDFETTAYAQMINEIGSARKAFVTKADADARAGIETLDARSKDVTSLIPEDEMRAVANMVKQSQNPITVTRWARIVRDENIKKQYKRATPQDIQSHINAANGNPGAAYPNTPPRVSDAINTSSYKFGVSASYLGAMVNREYGQYLRPQGRGNQKYAPVPMHEGATMSGLRPDVADAAMVAGEIFGQPLKLTSGYRSQAKQDAIRARGNPNRSSVARFSHHTKGDALDISTVGMKGPDKARLISALVDAGFTGFGEYNTHIHADMRTAVPQSFGARNNKAWGGWTYLSPEVAQTLVNRGFAANATSQSIQRGRPLNTVDEIDYGKGNAAGASSAVGVAQFTEDTFLGLMKDGTTAQRIGVDVSKMSDAQILELRKDPDISIQAAAALAAQNRDAMRATFGRDIPDQELYMAHFLGSSGAIALIKARADQPNQSAAKLLPEAANANRSIFYDGNRQRTVDEVYGVLARNQATAPDNVAYGDNQTREKVLDNMTKGLQNDPVSFAENAGTAMGSDLSQPGGFAARGREAASIADYYQIPQNEMKPFKEQEVQQLKRSMDDGDAQQILDTLSAIQTMGPNMARAGLKQLGEKDPVYAYAGSLQMNTGGDTSVAGDIVRGRKRIEQNPSFMKGINEVDVNNAFSKAAGGALFQIKPEQREAVQQAATAHYAETYMARGGGWDEDAYARSVNKVLGGFLADVNGEPTLLPPGISGEQMEDAMRAMTPDDWANMSPQGVPPRYVDGTTIAPEDLADEAKLRAIGASRYVVELDDATLAVTGAMVQGRVETYIFAPDPAKIKNVLSRPENNTRNQSSRSAPESTDLPPVPEGGAEPALGMGAIQ